MNTPTPQTAHTAILDLLNPPAPIGRRPVDRVRFRRSLDRAGHLAARDACIAARGACAAAYAAAYDVAALAHGEGGPFAGVPGAPKVADAVMISGGTWSHWPDAIKQAVAKYIRAAHEWNDRALAHHKAAGFRWPSFLDAFGRFSG